MLVEVLIGVVSFWRISTTTNTLFVFSVGFLFFTFVFLGFSFVFHLFACVFAIAIAMAQGGEAPAPVCHGDACKEAAALKRCGPGHSIWNLDNLQNELTSIGRCPDLRPDTCQCMTTNWEIHNSFSHQASGGISISEKLC